MGLVGDCELEIWVCPDHAISCICCLGGFTTICVRTQNCSEFLIITTGIILPASEDKHCKSLFKSLSNTRYRGLQRAHLAPCKCVSTQEAMFSLGVVYTFSVRWRSWAHSLLYGKSGGGRKLWKGRTGTAECKQDYR